MDDPSKRGRVWFSALAGDAALLPTGLASILAADVHLESERALLLAVVPDPCGRFPRARRGEVGLEEGWALARCVRALVAEDELQAIKRPILAVVDSRSQAYGRLEELLGIHLALAAAADAYVSARSAGHPVVALIVGQAISGALLAHGIQAHRMLALDAPGVIVHAMHEESAARITRRSIAELDALGKTVLPMSYDIEQYAKLGLLHELVPNVDADAPSAQQVADVGRRLAAAVADVRARGGDLVGRLDNASAKAHRTASIAVRQKLAAQWEP